MAIQLASDFICKGVPISAAYARIPYFFGGKDGGYEATALIYYNKNARFSTAALDTVNVKIDFADGDPYPMLYAALKALFPSSFDV